MNLQPAVHGRALALALLGFSIVRLFSVVFSEPMVGFANQYDMHRTSACVGLWPADVAIGQATPEAPRAVLQKYPARNQDCYPSTQAVVAWLALRLDSIVDTVAATDSASTPMQMIGLTGALLWLLCTILISYLCWHRPGALLLHGLISAFLIADPINTLYLNTLYTEFPALIGAYGAGAVVLSLWLDPKRPHWRLSGLLLCMAMLGLSRVQHLALPIVFSTFALFALWRHNNFPLRTAVLFGSLCLLLAVFQMSQQSSWIGIQRANIANTVLGSAMPAGNPELITAELGLPPVCAELAYSTWYRQHGMDIFAVCPELEKVSRLRLLHVTLTHPGVFSGMMLRGLVMSQNLRLGYLGELAGATFTHIDKTQNLLWFSVSELINRLPPILFLVVTVAICSSLLAFATLLLLRRKHALHETSALTVLLLLAVSVFLLSWLSSVFGDGYSEVGRHLHLGMNALLIAVLAGACLASVALAGIFRGKQWYSSTQWIFIFWALLGVFVPALFLSRHSIGFGLIDEPSGVLSRHHDVLIKGWALDLWPIIRIEARIDGHTVQSMQRIANPDLKNIFPSVAHDQDSDFVGSVESAHLANGRFLEIVATNAREQTWVLERRRIR